MIDRYGIPGQATSLRQMMDRLFENAIVMPWKDGTSQWGGPALDVFEEDDNLIVEAHLPGVKPEDLEVQVEQGVLTIAATIQSEHESKDRRYLVREQRSGRFVRTVQLPPGISHDPSQAIYQDGVLRLVFAKNRGGQAASNSVDRGWQSGHYQ
jgi:HSP20 family protein